MRERIEHSFGLKAFVFVVVTAVLAACGSSTQTVTVRAAPTQAGTTTQTVVLKTTTTRTPTAHKAACVGVTINAHTSCAFARAVKADYLALPDNTIGQRSAATGQTYSLNCSGAGGIVTCTTGTAVISFRGPAPPSQPSVTQTTSSAAQTTTPQPTNGIAPPDPALCQSLYNQWQAGGPGAQAAIVEYGQIGCGQSPRTDGNTWCKTFHVDGQAQAICDFPPNTPGAYPPNQ